MFHGYYLGTGAYYTARLAACEYLARIKKQASVLVLREERPEYWAPLGVGILRELSRNAFNQQPEKPESIKQAFQIMGSRLKLDVNLFRQQSWLLKNYKKQVKLSRYF
ncbi:MAG: hypothetical protein NT076_03045 [Candidatus Pacearchaeota archaeon]|nr:hypothetical protein [Candidatus Pacearchaeota archaeon]